MSPLVHHLVTVRCVAAVLTRKIVEPGVSLFFYITAERAKSLELLLKQRSDPHSLSSDLA